MHSLRVGEPYNPRLRVPDATMNWRFTEQGVELLLGYARPTSDEVRDVRTGPAQFALVAGDHALIMAHRFGVQPWQDTPWQATLQSPADKPGLVTVPEGKHLTVLVVLVDADTGLVKALRQTTWNHRFAQAVNTAIRRQLAATGPNRAQAEIQDWYGRYPNTTSLVDAADIRSTDPDD